MLTGDINTVRQTALVADDHGAVRTLAGAFLPAACCEVLAASNDAEGSDVIERRDESIALLFSEATMPTMSWLKLATAVRIERPQLPACFIPAVCHLSRILDEVAMHRNAGLIRSPALLRSK